MRENKAALREELTRLVEAYDGPITRERNTGRVTVRCQICHSRRTVTVEFLCRFGVWCTKCSGAMRAA
jgi:hypothetical protein